MNYGGDAADQIVRYSMEVMEHTLRIIGSIAKNLAVLIVAVMKDQKKTRGKTNDRCSNEGPEKDQGKDQPASDVKGTAGNEIFHHSP